MQVDLQHRTFGEIVSLVFSVTFARFGQLVAIALVLGLPLLFFLSLTTSRPLDPSDVSIGALLGAVGAWVLSVVVQFVAQGAYVLIVAGAFRGDHPTTWAALSAALRRIGSLFAVSSLVGLAVGLGALAFLIPGLILFARYYVAVPALLVEELSPAAAMQRSRVLTEDRKALAFGVAVLVGAFIYLVVMVSASAIAAYARDLSVLAAVAIQWLVVSVSGIFGSVAAVVFYFQMRIEKEAYDVDSLAQLVDRIGERDAE